MAAGADLLEAYREDLPLEGPDLLTGGHVDLGEGWRLGFAPPPGDRRALLAAARCGALASPDTEGDVLPFLEALARKGPVLAADLQFEATSGGLAACTFEVGFWRDLGAHEGPMDPAGAESASPGWEGGALPPDPPPAPDLDPRRVEARLRRLLADPAWAVDPWIAHRLAPRDEAVLLPFGAGDAGLIRVGGDRALALALRCARPAADPFWEAARTASEASRAVASVGAQTLGLAVRLPRPGTPEAARDLDQAVLGLRQACLALDLPVLSLDFAPAAFPGPVVAALGLMDDLAPPVDVAAPDAKALAKVGNRYCGSAFRAPFDGIFLLGGEAGAPGPELALDDEFRLQACLSEGIRLGLLRSAHGVAGRGLLPAALDAAFGGAMGCQLLLEGRGLPLDTLLFGPRQGQTLVSVGPEGESALQALAHTHRIPAWKIGVAGGGRVTLAVDGQPVLEAEAAELKTLHVMALELGLGG